MESRQLMRDRFSIVGPLLEMLPFTPGGASIRKLQREYDSTLFKLHLGSASVGTIMGSSVNEINQRINCNVEFYMHAIAANDSKKVEDFVARGMVIPSNILALPSY